MEEGKRILAYIRKFQGYRVKNIFWQLDGHTVD
jgi:hypothetical protein